MSKRDKGATGAKRVAHPRYLLFVIVLVAATLALLPWPLTNWIATDQAVLTAFDLAVVAFLLSCIPLWRKGDPHVIRREAERDDVRQGLLLLLTALISAVVLVALSTLVLNAGTLKASEIVILLATLTASWLFTNLVYAFHYARIYYAPAPGGDSKGLAFPGNEEPGFTDFVNFAFVIGMTCQTADIEITSAHMRRISTWHGLFAFVFNLGILALTVNVLAGIR